MVRGSTLLDTGDFPYKWTRRRTPFGGPKVLLGPPLKRKMYYGRGPRAYIDFHFPDSVKIKENQDF